MELVFSLALIWVLTRTAGALQCLTCTDLLCSSMQPLPCAPDSKCLTAFILVNNNGFQFTQNFKACVPSSLCLSSNGTYSANLGNISAGASFECCETDNCNSRNLSAPSVQANNSLECFSCATPQCNTPIQCMGAQDRCFQLNATSGPVSTSISGCASANLCLAAPTLATLPILQTAGNITIGPTCCNTSLCNGVRVATESPTEANTPTPAPATTTTIATTTTSSDSSRFRPGMILVTLGLFFFTVC